MILVIVIVLAAIGVAALIEGARAGIAAARYDSARDLKVNSATEQTTHSPATHPPLGVVHLEPSRRRGTRHEDVARS